MRRIAILVVLIALDMWLIGSSPMSGGVTIPGVLNNSVSAQDPCCPPGTGHFHPLGCLNGQCVELEECGFDDCSACQGCDPNDEAYCLDIGWIWDSENCECYPPECDPAERNVCLGEGGTWDDATCTCTYPCNPSARQQCINAGGIWNDTTCTCNYPGCDPIARQQCIAQGCTWNDITCTCTCPQGCNPGPPVYEGSETDTSSWCVTCGMAEECTTIIDFYVQYCQDGTVYDRWSVLVYDGCTFRADGFCWEACLLD